MSDEQRSRGREEGRRGRKRQQLHEDVWREEDM